ncbi:hypothetical protein CDAR_605821 [Caerostris darwini]|uniref:Uncharacterized protein n=1 Tax=Caerostris darwini TaxID=1538125 RepID=A0AAV4UAL2_9ARAC|nr:hypothetical protein CDAR_605821 [Caerostris darwini]
MWKFYRHCKLSPTAAVKIKVRSHLFVLGGRGSSLLGVVGGSSLCAQRMVRVRFIEFFWFTRRIFENDYLRGNVVVVVAAVVVSQSARVIPFLLKPPTPEAVITMNFPLL